jgi:thiamine-monophosphate kinase
MSEFELIDILKGKFSGHAQSCDYPAVLGIGDDAAVLSVPEGKQLVVSTDTLVSDVHFFADTAASDIAAKSLAVSLSDLASMGAEPAWFFLAISLPDIDLGWWEGFCDGLLQTAQDAKIDLAGGDTTRGPLSITITAMGLVDPGRALRRDGAQPGDLVFVSGTPGLAACALRQRLAGNTATERAVNALNRPQARLALGKALSGLATACIDVSDGLAADLGHLLAASGCGAELFTRQLPRLDELSHLDDDNRWAMQLGGGDDYELCFTLPGTCAGRLPALVEQAGTELHAIGKIVVGSGLKVLQDDGQEWTVPNSGFDHFRIQVN